METPQHGIGPKSEFGSVSFFFQELSEIPLKLESVEEFPNILGRFPLYLHLIRFPFFLVRFLFFWVRFRFSEKDSTNNLGQIGSALLTFIGFKQTDKHTERQAKYIFRENSYFAGK